MTINSWNRHSAVLATMLVVNTLQVPGTAKHCVHRPHRGVRAGVHRLLPDLQGGDEVGGCQLGSGLKAGLNVGNDGQKAR